MHVSALRLRLPRPLNLAINLVKAIKAFKAIKAIKAIKVTPLLFRECKGAYVVGHVSNAIHVRSAAPIVACDDAAAVARAARAHEARAVDTAGGRVHRQRLAA